MKTKKDRLEKLAEKWHGDHCLDIGYQRSYLISSLTKLLKRVANQARHEGRAQQADMILMDERNKLFL